MSERKRLPNRRRAVAFECTDHHQRFRAHVGFDGNRIAEVFIDAAKPNSEIDAFAADAAILISPLLQRGAVIEEIEHALRRNPNGTPAGLIDKTIAGLIAMEPKP